MDQIWTDWNRLDQIGSDWIRNFIVVPVPFLFPFEREELAFPLLWLWQGKSFQIKNDDFFRSKVMIRKFIVVPVPLLFLLRESNSLPSPSSASPFFSALSLDLDATARRWWFGKEGVFVQLYLWQDLLTAYVPTYSSPIWFFRCVKFCSHTSMYKKFRC